jgi:hypothetical protein
LYPNAAETEPLFHPISLKAKKKPKYWQTQKSGAGGNLPREVVDRFEV